MVVIRSTGMAKPMPDVAGAGGAQGGDGGVDADYLTGGVDEWAAGVAGVDGGVGLDGGLAVAVVAEAGLAVDGADDAGGHRSFQAEWGSDGQHRVADLELRGPAERERAQSRGVGGETWSTARSLSSSTPTMRASTVRPLDRTSETSLAPSTT